MRSVRAPSSIRCQKFFDWLSLRFHLGDRPFRNVDDPAKHDARHLESVAQLQTRLLAKLNQALPLKPVNGNDRDCRFCFS